jgi:thioredoxin-like negative regulator of GroEL
VSARPFRLALLLVLLGPRALQAQDPGMSRAFELERRGEYAAAADAYRTVLTARPGDPAALLGLERVLLPIGRSAEILPQVRAALAASPSSGPIYGVAIRAWTAADEPDSLRAVAERWAAAAPGDETPYREWGAAALSRRDRPGATAAYLRGRERLHRPDALAAELAQVAVANGDFAGALHEWLPALRRVPGYRVTAVSTLSQAPDSIRSDLIRQLEHEHDFTAARLQAELRARWGDPLGALETLRGALPDDRSVAAEALRGLLDQLHARPGRDARVAEGRALELLAERLPDSERARLRLEAARVYTAAGERESARRMLAGIADDRDAPGTISAGASTTLVQVLIGEGKLEEAARRLADHRAAMSGDDYAALRRRLVLAHIQAGDLARADSALGADSTVEGLALGGRIRLYRGDIAGALERFKAAGPFAGERTEATERTALLALLQPIEADSLPALGQALLTLARGDTAQAVAALDRVAGELAAPRGGAEVRLLAGRLAAASGKTGDAERLLKAAAASAAPGTAPAAELALGELLLRQHRSAEAVVQLEHLILTYPGSALIPQARRRLDEARGAVPET